jgi:hypothetical protein
MFQLIPADSFVNSRRNNYPYGQVGVATWTSQNGSNLGICSTTGYSGVVFEPRDEYKGDLARIYFYMATRYESRIAALETIDFYGDAVLNGTAYPCFEPWFISMLLAWNEADPVSQKEIVRNNEIYYSYQHNRNPFIDYPEYAIAIWNPSSIVVPEPTNFPADFSADNIHLQWTDASGIVLPEAYLIRMSNIGFEAIQEPVDGVPVVNCGTDKNILIGIKEAWFSNLNPNTTYYFKMYGFSGTGTAINYKTDGLIPEAQMNTSP